uniref:Uncharacterized protein n=1 Tax=Aegilops tauschii subsp. strangulata TaxID=200361 RepID=A0A453N2N8_AEGTS
MATRDEQRQQPLPLHILFLLFFAPGHLIPVVDMAAIFSTHGAWCTILTKRPAMWAFHKDNDAADQMSFGEVFNSFHELEPDYVEHFRTTLGRRAWLVGPVALASKDMTKRGSADNTKAHVTDGCLRWLDTKPAGSVVYVSFGTFTSFSPAELRPRPQPLRQGLRVGHQLRHRHRVSQSGCLRASLS